MAIIQPQLFDSYSGILHFLVSCVRFVILQHPCQAIGFFLEREHFAGIFLEATRAFPELQGLTRAASFELDVTKVRGLLVRVLFFDSKELFQSFQLLSIACRNSNFDVDRAADIANGTTDAAGKELAGFLGREVFVREGDALIAPLGDAVLEELENRGANIVLSIEPRQLCIFVEGCLPDKGAIILDFCTKERIEERGEVVVVDAGINKSGREVELAYVVLYLVLGSPERERGPILVVGRVIGHG